MIHIVRSGDSAVYRLLTVVSQYLLFLPTTAHLSHHHHETVCAAPHLSWPHTAGPELIGDCSATLQHDTVNIIQACGHQSHQTLGGGVAVAPIKQDFGKTGRSEEGYKYIYICRYIFSTWLILPDLSDSNQIFLFTWKCFIWLYWRQQTRRFDLAINQRLFVGSREERRGVWVNILSLHYMFLPTI